MPVLARRRALTSVLMLPALASLRPAFAQVKDLNDAINKAGRQRMLSQRCAAAWLALGQGVRREQAEKVLAESMAQFDRALVELRAFITASGPLAVFAQLDSNWSAYKLALVGQAPGKATAEALLVLGDKVLAQAHLGTEQLEQLSGKQVGRLVNLAGRQRMLCQRMAASYLAASWGVRAEAQTRTLAQAQQEFQAAHAQLQAAADNTPAIRQGLELVEQQYTFFSAALRGLRPAQADARAQAEVFTASERILQVMDTVTGQYARL